MTLSVIITAGVTAYDCSDYVVLHSVEIDEQLFNPESFKPNTNKAVLRLHRTCPYIDEIFAADGDISIAITADAIPVFSGYLTDNYTLKITARGGSDVELTAEDPGIRLLKKPWASTGGLYTSFSGKKVCDSADSANSFVHILAALAGVTVSSTVPTISDLLYFSVEDKSKSQYWDILEGVLFDFRHTFYFDASGELCLFAFGGLTGTPSTDVRSDATILQKSLGDAGIEVKKRFIQYREAVINYKEGELVSSAVVFRDTTGQGLTDCDIEIAAGEYYPSSCDASTYAYIDYFLEDGRDILAITSATADFVVDTGITYEFAHIGKSAQIRFYNPTALPKHIRKLRVTGLNVYAVKADSTMTSNEGGGKKLEYEAKYLTENADAQSLANLLRYVYANSSALYTFRSYQGVLYPATDLYPSETLYPLGDVLELGGLVQLKDPVWTGLDVACAVYRKKYTVGKAGATFEALGIGTINLADTAAYVPVAKPNDKPIVGLYPTEKALTTTSDTVDFSGQYGVYNGQRYVGTMPNTWTLDDAGQTASGVAALVPVYTPGYLGAHRDGTPASAKNGDYYLRYSTTSGDENRGVFTYDGTDWTRTIDPIYLYPALNDIVFISAILDPDGTTHTYGAEADYGIDTTIQTAHIMTAIIDRLRVGDLRLSGTLTSKVMDTINPQTGETINAPTPTYWPGSELIDLCASLADGWHAVDSASSLDSKTISHAVKSSDNTVSLQSSDADESSSDYTTPAKTINNAAAGRVTIYFDVYNAVGGTLHPWIKVNGSTIYSGEVGGGWVSRSLTVTLALADVVTFGGRYVRFRNCRLAPPSGTIALWNSTDSTAKVFESTGYYDDAGTVNINSGTLDTSAIDTYWKGSELITLFAGKVTDYRTIDLGGGTFNSKTCDTIYKAGTASITLTFTDTSTALILADGYYDYAGSIVLDDAEGVLLIGDEDGDGQYEIWVHNIPGSTDLITTFRNRVSGDVHTITETRAPDRASGDIEATHALHAVHNSVDFVRDLSLHNYSGDMHVLDVFSNFTNDTLGDWKWYQQRHVDDWATSTAYSLGDLVVSDNKIYCCIIAGTSGGVAPTGTGLYINDYVSTPGCMWQYLGAEQSPAGSKIWGRTIAQLDSKRGNFWTAGGRRLTGKLVGTSYVTGDVFNALAPSIPFINDEIIVNGTYGTAVMTYAKRYSGTRIDLIFGGGSFESISAGGGGAVSSISIAW